MQRLVKFPFNTTKRWCGIVGYVGRGSCKEVLVNGISVLQNRGYDSCGIASVNSDGQIVVTKHASKGSTHDAIDAVIAKADLNHKDHRIGIAHTRWATHGGKTDENAHPHSDWKNRISLVHNGTIENFVDLKKECLRHHCTFSSETDSEVISNLIGLNLDEGMDFHSAVKAAVGKLRGTWGIAAIHKEHPDMIVLAANGSPLVMGSTENEILVASENTALAQYTNQYSPLADGEVICVTLSNKDNLSSTRKVHQIQQAPPETSPHPHKHWTIKEIKEQPHSLGRSLNYGGRMAGVGNRIKLGGLDAIKDDLMKISNMLLLGCGTSLHAALYGQLLMESLGCFETVKAQDAAEFTVSSVARSGQTGCILLSQSGETLDTIRAAHLSQSQQIQNLSLVNSVGSHLARLTGCGVYLNAGREVGVASTKAFTSQVSCLALIAAWFSQHGELPAQRKPLLDSVHRLPLYAGICLQAEEQCKKIANDLVNKKSMFVLGKGFGYPVALEGALKIKEISYLHAEGYSGSALKHGPFALIDEDDETPVFMIITQDENFPTMVNAVHETKARGARVTVLTDCPDLIPEGVDEIIVIPSNGPLTSLLASIPIQMIAYYLSIAKGINPDKPRGLAKTVTVA